MKAVHWIEEFAIRGRGRVFHVESKHGFLPRIGDVGLFRGETLRVVGVELGSVHTRPIGLVVAPTDQPPTFRILEPSRQRTKTTNPVEAGKRAIVDLIHGGEALVPVHLPDEADRTLTATYTGEEFEHLTLRLRRDNRAVGDVVMAGDAVKLQLHETQSGKTGRLDKVFLEALRVAFRNIYTAAEAEYRAEQDVHNYLVQLQDETDGPPDLDPF